ncbi:MAG: glycosyltransferase family 4 protein [candidate division WOR-3 bacterium]|nr:glycosyltransferase family 4 protein [candidate division WOR-3 bacterium]
MKHLIVITPNLKEASTGGLIWQKRFCEYASRVHEPTEIIDATQIPNIYRSIRLLNIVYYTLRLLRNKDAFLFVDHNLHVRLSIPLWLNKMIRKNHYGVICHHVVHGLRKNPIRRWIEFLSEKIILRNAVRIIVPSVKTSSDIEIFNVDTSRIVVINPTLVFRSALMPVRKNERRILFVGNIEPRKGLDTLIRALYLSKDIDFSCEIVGGCYGYERYLKGLLKLIENSRLSERIVFRGKLDSACTIKSYENANVFVFPSLHEGYGMVLLEAMSFGLPIVASDIAPVNEIVKDRLSGYLFAPGDEKSLAEVLRRLLLSFDLQKKIGMRNFKRSRDFSSWDKVVDKTFAVVKPYLHNEDSN